jgi:hypothetical protein
VYTDNGSSQTGAMLLFASGNSAQLMHSQATASSEIIMTLCSIFALASLTDLIVILALPFHM